MARALHNSLVQRFKPLKTGGKMKHTYLAVALMLSVFISQSHATNEAAKKVDEATQYNANNSGKNIRDRNPNQLTAQDQSNRESDVNITRAIRQSIVEDKDLSVNAQNVKIIVTKSTVTLKGPVASAQEVTSIEAKARHISPKKNIINQLEVIKQ